MGPYLQGKGDKAGGMAELWGEAFLIKPQLLAGVAWRGHLRAAGSGPPVPVLSPPSTEAPPQMELEPPRASACARCLSSCHSTAGKRPAASSGHPPAGIYTPRWGLWGSALPRPAASTPPMPPGSCWGSPSTEGEASGQPRSSQPPSPPQSTQEADDTDIEIFLLPNRQKNKIKFQSRFHNLGGRLQQRHRPLWGLRARPPPPQNIQIKPDAKNKYRFSGGGKGCIEEDLIKKFFFFFLFPS